MKKKFILWLCKVFQVELVEPMQATHHAYFVHEQVPYTLIQDNTQFQLSPFSGIDEEEVINQTKRDMLYRCIANMEKEGLITWSQWEGPMTSLMTRTTNIRCSFFAAPQKY
jgi:hypothetical protein